GKASRPNLSVEYSHRHSCSHNPVHEINDRSRSFAKKRFRSESFRFSNKSGVMQVTFGTNADRQSSSRRSIPLYGQVTVRFGPYRRCWRSKRQRFQELLCKMVGDIEHWFCVVPIPIGLTTFFYSLEKFT